jgi:hypothetical protein
MKKNDRIVFFTHEYYGIQFDALGFTNPLEFFVIILLVLPIEEKMPLRRGQ